MPNWQKLLTGIAASALLAKAAYGWTAQSILARLGTKAAVVLVANGVTDGAARWQSPAGWTSRTARLTGTADPATRARIAAELAAQPGIHAVEWDTR